MIEQLTGNIAHKGADYLIINVNGVGYKLFVTGDTLLNINNQKSELTMWTYMAVRENSLDLYGFLNIEDLNFFKLLLGISGIGPKSALGVLSVADTKTLKSAISTGDISYLTRVSGIGKKSAERIIIELKDKVSKMYSDTPIKEDANTLDAIDALIAMVYSITQARNAIKNVTNTNTYTDGKLDTSSKIKESLKLLTNKK